METNNQTLEKPTEVKRECVHFWDIEVANGPSSLGTCRYCGEVREFLNAFPEFNTVRVKSIYAGEDLTNVR